jgi:purine-nucleoside phosphorylase
MTPEPHPAARFETLRAAADLIAELTGRARHDLALVLGSGLGGYASTLSERIEILYNEIPAMPVPGVEGHGGVLVSAMADGYPVLAFTGRVHAYEGWDLAEVVFGVRTAVLAGCRTVVLTNAAGGVGDGHSPGDLVVIRDHINLTGRTPLLGRNDERLGLRFPDMTEVYTVGLRERLEETAAGLGEQLGSGVYAWLLGPAYETPAEVEMARRLGADLVGMSTVPEAIAARHMGARVVGISLVTNLAAGISATPLSHDEVQETATAARGRFSALLDAALPVLVP